MISYDSHRVIIVMKTDNNIYILNIDCLSSDEIRNKWYRQMPAYRKEKIDRFKPEGSKKLSLGAGILLDIALKNVGLKQYEVVLGENGKPYILDCENVFFNISHSGKMVALAISDREVGIDIQKLQHFDSALINYVFGKDEQLSAEDICIGETDMDMIYTRMWSMKESVMKHSGQGLGLEPKNISLTRSSGKLHASCKGFESNNLYLTEYPVYGYALTVCSTYGEFAKNPQMIDIL